MTKRSISLFLSLIFLLTLLVGCAPAKDDGSFDIICTVFPIYDWVRQTLLGVEGVNLSLLVDSGTDPHSYNATAEDIALISSCDMLIFVGGESDKWVTDALNNQKNAKTELVRLFDHLGDGAHTDHAHGEVCEGDDHDHSAYDEHVWLSLKNASILTKAISDRIADAIPQSAELIKKNTEAYVDRIDTLDAEAETAFANAKRKTLLFADRFPFGYLVRDYGLEYHAAFPGCSADSEASFATVVELTERLDELALPYVLVTETSDKKLANTVIAGSANKNAEILTLDSIQSISAEDIRSGSVSYIDVMKSNIDLLKIALG